MKIDMFNDFFISGRIFILQNLEVDLLNLEERCLISEWGGGYYAILCFA